MGFWNDGVRDDSRSRSPSRRKSSQGHYASRPSYSRSASSFFSLGGGSNSRGYSSRARPRSGFMARIRKFLRDLYSYMRRHPVKVFILVIMPLITGGALTKILGQFGVRLPAGLEQFAGGGRRTTERYYSRGGARDFDGGSALPGMGMGGGLLPGMGGGVGSALGAVAGIAKNFL